LTVVSPGQPAIHLIPARPGQFRVKEAPDMTFAFLADNGAVKTLKLIAPSGEYECPHR
jgi:hypothetical protein